MNLQDKISLLMKAKNIKSKAEFSRDSGIKYSTLNNVFNGTENITVSTVKKIADYFDVDVDYLIEDDKKDNLNNNLGDKLQQLRITKGWLEEDVARTIGISTNLYANIERGLKKPDLHIIKELSSVFGPVFSDVLGIVSASDIIVRVPVLNRISYIDGKLDFSEVLRFEDTPIGWVSEGEYFYIYSNDNSLLHSRIGEWDLLLIEKETKALSGNIIVVLFNNEIYIRRIYIQGEVVFLYSDNNTSYRPIICKLDDIIIIGRVVLNVINFKQE